jgi:hypothetical protein
MTYPPQPGWGDPVSGTPYVDPTTGQPAYPGSPAAYPASPAAYQPAQANYAGYGGYGYAAPVMVPTQQSTNGMAVASLVLSLCGLVSCGVTSLVGAILGHVARKQIRERGEGGDGLAMGGIIAGWIIFGLALIGTALYVVFFIWLVNQASQYPQPYSTY